MLSTTPTGVRLHTAGPGFCQDRRLKKIAQSQNLSKMSIPSVSKYSMLRLLFSS